MRADVFRSRLLNHPDIAGNPQERIKRSYIIGGVELPRRGRSSIPLSIGLISLRKFGGEFESTSLGRPDTYASFEASYAVAIGNMHGISMQTVRASTQSLDTVAQLPLCHNILVDNGITDAFALVCRGESPSFSPILVSESSDVLERIQVVERNGVFL